MSQSRRIPLVIGIAAGVICLAVLAFVFVPRLASGLSVGKAMEEVNGQTHTSHYAKASEISVADLPGWMPAGATDATLEVPGPNSKSPGGVQLDATVPPSFVLPPTCTPTGQNFPWAGGWDAVNPSTAKLKNCDGWTTTVVDAHLYTWR